ncbi:MAG TPA: signal peptidase I [Acidimicrobiales bacterium]|nr:signal peptidase I [Acidimicrobiales bacterium]
MAEVVIDEENVRRHRRRQLIEWTIVIVAALAAAVLLRSTAVQAFSIPSISMEKTLLIGDRVLVNKQNRDAHVGDVVVFKRPPGDEAAAIKDLIKRVIAVQGQTVSAEDGKLYVDGKPVNEPYLSPGTVTTMDAPVTVRCDCVFMMGDNRGQSRDSRFFGPIKKSSIIGHAYYRVWPPSRFGGI